MAVKRGSTVHDNMLTLYYITCTSLLTCTCAYHITISLEPRLPFSKTKVHDLASARLHKLAQHGAWGRRLYYNIVYVYALFSSLTCDPGFAGPSFSYSYNSHFMCTYMQELQVATLSECTGHLRIPAAVLQLSV